MLYYLFLQSLNSRCQLIKLSHVDPIKKNSFKKKKNTELGLDQVKYGLLCKSELHRRKRISIENVWAK